MDTQSAPQLLTVMGVAQMLSVSRPTIYRLLDEGLPALRLRDGGDLRFDRDDVLAWVESRKAAMAG